MSELPDELKLDPAIVGEIVRRVYDVAGYPEHLDRVAAEQFDRALSQRLGEVREVWSQNKDKRFWATSKCMRVSDGKIVDTHRALLVCVKEVEG